MAAASPNKHQGIRLACTSLEQALRDFEDDSEAAKRSLEEAEKLKEIKKQLGEIKKQLESLSG